MSFFYAQSAGYLKTIRKKLTKIFKFQNIFFDPWQALYHPDLRGIWDFHICLCRWRKGDTVTLWHDINSLQRKNPWFSFSVRDILSRFPSFFHSVCREPKARWGWQLLFGMCHHLLVVCCCEPKARWWWQSYFRDMNLLLRWLDHVMIRPRGTNGGRRYLWLELLFFQQIQVERRQVIINVNTVCNAYDA